MAGDFDNPSNSSERTDFMQEIRDNQAELGKMSGAMAHPPTGLVRYNPSTKIFEYWTGSAWSELDISAATIALAAAATVAGAATTAAACSGNAATCDLADDSTLIGGAVPGAEFGTVLNGASAVTNLDWTIALSGDNIFLLKGYLYNPLGGACDYKLYVNADYTDGNYASIGHSITGSSPASSYARNSSPLCLTLGAGGSAYLQGRISITGRYVGNWQKELMIELDWVTNENTISSRRYKIFKYWATSADISSIRLASVTASGVGARSRISAYKVK